MKGLLFLLTCCFASSVVHAQPFETDADKQGLKSGVHWVKRTWYNPLNGTAEPDKAKIPDIYMRPNQLIEYGKDGKLRSVMDYARGTDDMSGPTERYYWKDGRLQRKVRENDAYEAITSTAYTYGTDGNEIKSETKPGPGDKTGLMAAMASTTESTWNGSRLTTLVTRDRNGKVGSTTYTYDTSGRKTKEVYDPVSLYSARTYEYDQKGNLIKDTYLDKEGKPSTIWTFDYNAAGKPLKRVMSHFYQGKKDREEITTYSYNSQGDTTSQKTVSDGKATYDYGWQHKYDEKKEPHSDRAH